MRTFWQNPKLLDLLFRLRLYRGVRVPCPDGLTYCTMHRESDFTVVYKVEIDDRHPLADWLYYDCEGPWAVGMRRPLGKRDRYIAFSRAADAVMFRMNF